MACFDAPFIRTEFCYRFTWFYLYAVVYSTRRKNVKYNFNVGLECYQNSTEVSNVGPNATTNSVSNSGDTYFKNIHKHRL